MTLGQATLRSPTRHAKCWLVGHMHARVTAVTVALVLALFANVGAGQADGCSDAASCPELITAPSPAIEVAGVQASADDARQAGETEPFIINSGFGD
jgi:hypothetical protein